MQSKYRCLPNYGREKLHGDLLEHYRNGRNKDDLEKALQHINVGGFSTTHPRELLRHWCTHVRSHFQLPRLQAFSWTPALPLCLPPFSSSSSFPAPTGQVYLIIRRMPYSPSLHVFPPDINLQSWPHFSALLDNNSLERADWPPRLQILSLSLHLSPAPRMRTALSTTMTRVLH